MNKAKERSFIIMFLVPSIILFALFYAVPIIEVVVTSFCNWQFIDEPTFAGLKNYMYLFKDPDFRVAVINTIKWVVLQCVIQVPLAVIVALVLSKKPFGWKFTRTAYVIPNIISSAAIGMIFLNMLDPQIGIINSVMGIFIEGFDVRWLTDSKTAFFAVTLSWIFFAGIHTQLIMAEITSIPSSLIEAAKVDGASNFKIDIYIILPLLKNVIGTVTILAVNYAIIMFDMVYMLTKGGPGNSTLNVGLYLFKSAMLENNYGLANAVGVIQMAIGLISIALISKMFKIGKSNA